MRITSPLFALFRVVYQRVFGTRLARLIWLVPGAHAFYRWLMPRVRPRVVEVDGHRIALDPMDSLLLSVNGNYETFEQSIFRSCIDPGDTVVDVGAHIGLYTLQAARAVGPSGHVIAFEPSAANYALLEENVTSNGYDNVTLVRAAVADRAGSAELTLSKDNTGDNFLASGRDSGRATESISTVTLDDFLAGRRVQVVKMDIQGAEPAALAGAGRTLAAAEDLVLFTELSPVHMRDWGGVGPFVSRLAESGFEMHEILEEEQTLVRKALEELSGFEGRSTADHCNLVCVKGARLQRRLAPLMASRAATD